MNLTKLFFFVCITKSSSSTILTEKAAFFANSVFKNFITTVVWWHNRSDEVTDFIKLFQGCILVAPVRDDEISNKTIRKFNLAKSFTQTVYFAANVYEVEYFVSLLYQDLVIPIHLIVVLTNLPTYNESYELMEIAWKRDVADILLISLNNDDVTLTTYFPYTNGKCGDFTPVQLTENSTNLFPKKFSNFHGCEIRTTLLDMSPYSRLKFENNTFVSMSGIDGNILHILFDVLNANMKVISTKDHGGLGTMVNGTATGSFGDLVNKKADIFLPGLFMTKTLYTYIQFSHPFETAYIIWFGPRQRKLSEWLQVLQPFMSHITPVLVSTAIVFVVATRTIQRFDIHKTFPRGSVIFQTFTIFLGLEVRFESKSLLSNGLFLLWIWFCMVVRIAYQGDLVKGLQRTVLESPLRSFDTSLKLVEGYGGIESVRDLYNGTAYYKDFKVIPFSNVTKYLKDVEAGKKFLIATDKKLGLDAAPNIQILEDDPVTSGPMCFCLRPGWPVTPEFDQFVLKIMEVGLVEKVNREHSWEWAKAVESKVDREAKPLTLEVLSGCFYGLGAMYGVCILFFLLEISYHRMKFDKKKSFSKYH